MTAPDQAHAPGCWGSALTFKAKAPECISCEFNTGCAPASAVRATMLAEKFGLPQKPVKTPVVRARPEIPKKVETLLERIEKLGIDVRGVIGDGNNPFTSAMTGMMFMALATHLLLRCSIGIERKMLVEAYQKKFSWSEGTAISHALQAFQAFCALGVASEQNGRLKLRTQNER